MAAQDAYLTDVSMSSATDGWAVGVTGPSSYGVLMHYNGSAWSRQTVPTGTYSINAVKLISPTEGWAVEADACSTDCDALFLHYKNGARQKMTVPPPGNQTGYAVGKSRQSLHYNGPDWPPVSLGLNSLPLTLTVRMQSINTL